MRPLTVLSYCSLSNLLVFLAMHVYATCNLVRVFSWSLQWVRETGRGITISTGKLKVNRCATLCHCLNFYSNMVHSTFVFSLYVCILCIGSLSDVVAMFLQCCIELYCTL